MPSEAQRQDTPERVVIVGAGHAGCQLAFSLRDNGFAGTIQLVNGENTPPYQRPPLSKAYLKSGDLNAILFRSEQGYAEQDIEVVSGWASKIDPASKSLTLRSGAVLPYDHLVLAGGTRKRTLPGATADKEICYLKTLAETDSLRQKLAQAARVCVIGAGFIGLEFASLAAALGKSVYVVDRARDLMGRAASRQVSDYFLAQHRAAGTTFYLDSEITGVERFRSVTTVFLKGGVAIHADLVLAGLGVEPETALAETAGLKVGNGIVVDHRLATSDPSISAIGDCVQFPSVHANAPIRLECVQNANDQARTLAARLVGKEVTYDALPWFWSDQGPDKLQIAGLPGPADQRILRGSPESKRFSVFSFRQNRLFAVESVNSAADHMVARKLISNDVPVCPEDLADMSKPIKSFLTKQPAENNHASV